MTDAWTLCECGHHKREHSGAFCWAYIVGFVCHCKGFKPHFTEVRV